MTPASCRSPVQRETEALRVEVSGMKRTAAERREQLLKEAGIHAGIKKDTEAGKAWSRVPEPLLLFSLLSRSKKTLLSLVF